MHIKGIIGGRALEKLWENCILIICILHPASEILAPYNRHVSTVIIDSIRIVDSIQLELAMRPIQLSQFDSDL